LFEENEGKHKAMDERVAALEAGKAANDAKMKDAEEKEKKESEEQKAKDAEKEKEENEIKDALADEAPAGEEEKAKVAKDSSYLVESFQQTKAKAEIIASGIHFPVFDKAANPKDTFMSICGLRRKAIQSGARDAETLAMLIKLTGGKAFDSAGVGTMPCNRVKILFDCVADMKRLANNAKATSQKTDVNAILNSNTAPVKDAESFKASREKARKERGQEIN